MLRRDASGERTKREKSRGADAASDAIAQPVDADPAKALVMDYFRQLVVNGYAEWHSRENGDVQLRLRTGETYLLARTTIRRIA